MNISRKDLSQLHFDDEARVQEKQQVKDWQSCIPFSTASFQIAVRSTSPHIATVFHVRPRDRFI